MQLASTGGRRLRHAALAARKFVLESGHTVTRKDLSASARDAEKALRLSAPQRLVLGQLVACWGELAMARLLVWPSNRRLTATTGLSERAVRNALRALIDLQLVIPKDSPNGKRYAVRDPDGAVVDAFGFDLTPLHARRGEWRTAIAGQKQLQENLKRAFDEITVCRRAAEEAVNALARHFPAADRGDLEGRLAALLARTPRRSGTALPDGLVDAWKGMRHMAEEAFYRAGCDGTECRQRESDEELPSETCGNGRRAEAPSGGRRTPPSRPPLPVLVPVKSEAERTTGAALALDALVVEACPVVSAYARPIRDPVDLVAAGRFLRASLGAHPSAWDEAVHKIGAIQAAGAVIYVLQLCDDDVARGTNRIRNPGGYLRTVVRLIGAGQLDLRAELLALRRRRMT